MKRGREPAHLTIAAVAACFAVSALIAAPVSAGEAEAANGCLGEGGPQLPGTWQIEGSDRFEATADDGQAGPDGGSAEEGLQSDCALV